jgi:hypothetical protein
MKKNFKLFGIIFLFALIAFSMAACAADDEWTNPAYGYHGDSRNPFEGTWYNKYDYDTGAYVGASYTFSGSKVTMINGATSLAGTFTYNKTTITFNFEGNSVSRKLYSLTDDNLGLFNPDDPNDHHSEYYVKQISYYDGGWNGHDISNWPAWEETRLYFRVTNDKQYMAICPNGNSDGKGKYIPTIHKVQREGKGEFPVGKWHRLYYDWMNDFDVEFTDTTFTRYYYGEPHSYNYTISGDYFILKRIN